MLARAVERIPRIADGDSAGVLRDACVGLEKESLRVDPSGYIALTEHPRALGSALTHPHITTDFSEALIEFVTPPFTNPADTIHFLHDLHVFAYQHLGDELLWCTSMPCMVGDDETIPIARYGQSNVGTMKSVYRNGLSYRYGRTMQTIAGVHFNYSLPELFWARLLDLDTDTAERDQVDAGYFACVRNFLRFGWLVPLLFGSSPAVCKTFLGNAQSDSFEMLDDGTCFEPFATSLRMSDIGYKNSNQASLTVNYDSLHDYVTSLTHAIETPHPEYQNIGVEVNGEYRQLNANLLQIENEFYSSIRPKQITQSGEKPTVALRRRGVRYLEVRSLDLDPFEPVGVALDTLRVVETLVVLCALTPSGTLEGENENIQRNLSVIPKHGRDPALTINVLGHNDHVFEHARRLLDAMQPIAAMLDRARVNGGYADALTRQRQRIERPHDLPSSRILTELRAQQVPFFRYAMDLSRSHAQQLRGKKLNATTQARLDEESRHSLAQQVQIEQADAMSFEQYLRRYFSQSLDQRESILG